jgi:predicted acetyltransferase
MPIEIRRATEDEVVPWLESLTTAFLDRPDVAVMAPQVIPNWDFSRLWGAFDGRVVGTLRSWATELTVPGGAHVPATALSAVSVLPTHRRRGILRSMLAAEQDAARERGEIVGLLYASEATIYGRFGYGTAVTSCDWTIDTRSTSLLGGDASRVSFAPIDETTRDTMRNLFDEYRKHRLGEIRRRDFTFGLDLGLLAFAWETPWKGWLILHRDADGRPDGFVRYSAESKWTDGIPRSIVKVQDFVALDDAAHDDLWRFLFDIDLVSTIQAGRRRLDERITWLLSNPRAAVASDIGDGLHVALLDLPAALAARTYGRAAGLVIEVIEADPSTRRTRLRLEAGEDGARCAVTEASPDLTLHADALGAAYLGGSRLAHAVLARGFDEHRAGSLALADALFRTLDEPSCLTFF